MRVTASGRERERKRGTKIKKGETTTWNGWNSQAKHTCANVLHILVGVDIQLLYFLLTHEVSYSQRCVYSASLAANSTSAMVHSFDFMFAFVLALLNPQRAQCYFRLLFSDNVFFFLSTTSLYFPQHTFVELLLKTNV